MLRCVFHAVLYGVCVCVCYMLYCMLRRVFHAVLYGVCVCVLHAVLYAVVCVCYMR